MHHPSTATEVTFVCHEDPAPALQAAVQAHNCRAAIVLSGMGSLSGSVAFDGTRSSAHLYLSLHSSNEQVQRLRPAKCVASWSPNALDSTWLQRHPAHWPLMAVTLATSIEFVTEKFP